jgi:hypothetical protein
MFVGGGEMKIDILDKTKKKRFLEGVDYFGDLKTNALLIKTGSERIRAYTGALSTEEIWNFWRAFAVEGVGLYVGKEVIDKSGVKDVRLSLDGLHLFGDQIISGILVLNESQEEKWFLGEEVAVGGDSVKGLSG